MPEAKKPAKSANAEKAKAKTPKPTAEKSEAFSDLNEQVNVMPAVEGSDSTPRAAAPEAAPRVEKQPAKAKKEAPAPAEPPKENLSLNPEFAFLLYSDVLDLDLRIAPRKTERTFV